MANAGYSTRPLHLKLGFKDGHQIGFVQLPEELEALKGACDLAVCAHHESWDDLARSAPTSFDVIMGFTKQAVDLRHLEAMQTVMKPDGMIWVCWPKKASKVPTDITEDVVRASALEHDLVDVKVAAVSDVWSGLKLMIRKTERSRYNEALKQAQ